MQVTDNHPYWVNGTGGVDSAQLKSGMEIDSYGKQPLTVVSVASLGVTEKTYNFTVADYHTYFAGAAGAFVHNCSCALNAAPGPLFRGGQTLEARLGVDVKAAADGLIHPVGSNGKPQGLSLNIDPKDKFIQQYGGAFPVNDVPKGLQVLQSGKPGHDVVSPEKPMAFESYQQLLKQIQLGNFNVLP